MTIKNYIEKQAEERQEILSAIHAIIMNADKKAEAKVGTMMGKEMILYLTGGIFKYGLSSVKDHISLHIMPIYGSPKLHAKYKNLLPKAKFQKGCINFKTADAMPLDIVRDLLDEAAGIDLLAIIESIRNKSGKK